MVSYKPQPLYLRGKRSLYLLNRKLGKLQSKLDSMKKRKKSLVSVGNGTTSPLVSSR